MEMVLAVQMWILLVIMEEVRDILQVLLAMEIQELSLGLVARRTVCFYTLHAHMGFQMLRAVSVITMVDALHHYQGAPLHV